MKGTLIEEQGLMTADRASERLGVTIRFFIKNVSPNIGQYFGKRKLYTEKELLYWLKTNVSKNEKVVN